MTSTYEVVGQNEVGEDSQHGGRMTFMEALEEVWGKCWSAKECGLQVCHNEFPEGGFTVVYTRAGRSFPVWFRIVEHAPDSGELSTVNDLRLTSGPDSQV